MEINRGNIFDIMFETGIRPDKDYGQNFLVEVDVCKRIVDALNIDKNESVLEIGPGLGSLTHFLNEQTDNLTVVDIDDRMVDFLTPRYEKVNVVLDDIRKHDVSNYDKIIGNLPYNITTETIVYLLSNAVKVKKLVLMIQIDAFSHFYDIDGKEYGPASILLHLLGDSKKLFQVKPGCFHPVPKCVSVVFEININPICELIEAKKVYSFAKNMFVNRRKTISNNLNNYIKDKELTTSVLEECHISLSTRPENISPNQYLNLYRSYKKHLSK